MARKKFRLSIDIFQLNWAQLNRLKWHVNHCEKKHGGWTFLAAGISVHGENQPRPWFTKILISASNP
jgi:hypothetical protein